ncbi:MULTISPECIES: extracellular solute-binding protein [unclassified Inquilinus]|uniref:extracellular solute-binding protein n=1 Tax=unclassified Inquilinus TaxID=2645927 RepID=UPI003F925228
MTKTLLGPALALVFAAALTSGPSAWAADPATIRIVSKDFTNSNPDDVKLLAAIEAGMAAQGHPVKLELVDLPPGGYADKLSLMLLSGDIPDLIYFQGGDQKIVEQGLLEDWRPWLEKAPHLKQALWAHNKPRLENYPYLIYPFPVRAKVGVIRQDWLEKTGLPAPQTLDDWEALFRKIVDSDLDGDGKKDTWGITVATIPPAGATDELDEIFNQAFGVTATWIKDPSGQWISARVSTQERDKIAFYHKLFAEGLLDPDFITTKWDTREDKFYSGRVGVVLGVVGVNIDIYQGKMRQVHPGVNLVPLDPPKGPGGQGLRAVDVSRESRGFAMSALSEHKDDVVALLDFMASPQGQQIDRMGFEGEEWVKDGGTVKTTDKMSTWYPRFLIAQPEAWTPPAPLLSAQAEKSIAIAQKFYSPDDSFVFPSDYTAQLDALENIYRSYVWKFVSGELPMEKWGDYVADWNANGGTAVTEYARTKLNGTN